MFSGESDPPREVSVDAFGGCREPEDADAAPAAVTVEEVGDSREFEVEGEFGGEQEDSASAKSSIVEVWLLEDVGYEVDSSCTWDSRFLANILQELTKPSRSFTYSVMYGAILIRSHKMEIILKQKKATDLEVG